MKQLAAEQIIEQYICYAEIEGQTKLDGDYKLGNKMVAKLNKLYDAIQGDEELAKTVLWQVMHSDSGRARGIAACDALRLRIHIKEALKVLKQESKRKDILGFGPEIALETWKEKGSLNI